MTRRRPPRREPPLSDEDLRLWRHVTRHATPLHGRETPPAPAAVDSDAAPDRQPASPVPPRHQPLPDLAPGQSPGLERRIAQRLKRGRLVPEARLDLHGLTQAEAHRALRRFILGSRAEGRKCVLVITGKGSLGGGVLRDVTPRWLNEAPLRGSVLAIEAAHARHGGGGAYYVLLRRTRSG